MITKLTEEEFNEFAIHHPNSIFFQSSYWGKLKQSTGWIPHLVGLKENNKITSATLLLAKKIRAPKRKAMLFLALFLSFAS